MKTGRTSAQRGPGFEYGYREREYRAFLKQTLLLATAIFLMTAPAPDSNDIAGFTANFIVTNNHMADPSLHPGQSLSGP